MCVVPIEASETRATEELNAQRTSSPRIVPTSAATRLATEVAATRRGCVHAMTFPEPAHPAS